VEVESVAGVSGWQTTPFSASAAARRNEIFAGEVFGGVSSPVPMLSHCWSMIRIFFELPSKLRADWESQISNSASQASEAFVSHSGLSFGSSGRQVSPARSTARVARG